MVVSYSKEITGSRETSPLFSDVVETFREQAERMCLSGTTAILLDATLKGGVWGLGEEREEEKCLDH